MIKEKAFLRNIEISDADKLVSWFNDQKLCYYMDDSEENKTYTNDDILLMTKSNLVYYFSYVYDNKVIGYASLYDINNQKAEFSFLIGDINYHSKGLGAYILKLLEEKANLVGITKLFCYINIKNISSIKCVEKSHFVRNKLLQENNLSEYYYEKVIGNICKNL